MKVLILAAGQGDRLEHLTDEIPKALVKVAGRELIRYPLAFLDHPAVGKIGVVTGCRQKPLLDFLKKEAGPVAIFKNPQFTQGSILSLQAALPFLDDDFLLMNVDHIYPRRLLGSLLKQLDGITAVCDFDRKLSADDMKISKNGDGRLVDIHKELKNYDGGYIGMTYCPRRRAAAYKKGIEAVLEKWGPKASVEMVLRALIGEGETIRIADASGIRWLEVDTPGDLEAAENILNSHPNFLS